MKKILMALTLVGLIQVSAEAQTKSCTCKTSHHTAMHHSTTHHHYAYRHMHRLSPANTRIVSAQRYADERAVATSTLPPATPTSKANTNLVPDNLSAFGSPAVYKEKYSYSDQNNNINNNVTLAPTSGRNNGRPSPCRSLNYASNNRVHAYAGYRRHNIIVNDDMNNPYQGEPSRQNDGVKKNEQRNLNAYQTGIVLPGNDGSRP
ncbi:MAG: hypothetical protein ACTHJ0_14025 [Flavipsychrobacter sp.]